MLRCEAVSGGGAEREQWRPLQLHSPLDFSLSLCYPQSNWAPLVLVPEWVGLCKLSAPVGLSNDLSCAAGRLSGCCPNPHGCFQSEVGGFISPRWSTALRGLLCSPPFVQVYLCASVGPRGATRLSACPFLHHSESALSVYLCMNVGPQGLLVVRLPSLFFPHSTSLGAATAT